MKGKIIYVDFIKKRRITFIHFFLNKIIALISLKFSVNTYFSPNLYIKKNRHISN